MFRTHVLVIRTSKLHYTALGIITPIGGRPVHSLREDCSLQKVYFMPVHVSSTYAHHQEVEILLHSLGIITLLGLMIPEAV